MKDCKGVGTTGTPLIKCPLNGEEPLDWEGHSLYRTAVGKLIWLCTVRPDCDFSVKELSRAVQGPAEEDLAKLKYLLRYLKKTANYGLQLQPTHTLRKGTDAEICINSCGDADWTGCRATRKSTTGCVVQVLGCTATHCSRTQASVALSSCEAECYGTGTAMSEGLFIKSMIKETGLGRPVLTTHTDSSSGKAFSLKFGLTQTEACTN